MKTLEQYQTLLRDTDAKLEVAAEAVRGDLDCRDWSVDHDLLDNYKKLFYKAAQLKRMISRAQNKLAVAQKSATPNV